MYFSSLHRRTPYPAATLLACSAALLRLVGAFVVDVSRAPLKRAQDSEPAAFPLDATEKCAEGARKKYDLVIFGATGFTGKLGAQYLAGGHRDRPRWAIAGRSQEKLDRLRRELAGGGPDTAAPSGSIVANLNDEASLLNMTRQARVVLSFAGPYEYTHGERLIKAAIKGCAHYADIAGETPWKAHVLTQFGEAAKKRGVAIAQPVGYDSMPFDLLARLAAEAVAADGQGAPTSVLVVNTRVNSWPSGGSVRSGLGAGVLHPGKADPYALIPETPPDARVDSAGGALLRGYHPAAGEVLQPSVMAEVNLPVIRRTLGILFPGTAISAALGDSLESGLNLVKFYMDPRTISDTPPLPLASGSGPPKWVREKGSWAAHAIATRLPDGRRKVVYAEGQGDAGYQSTARMATEFALAMLPGARSNVTSGYVTPALAMDLGTLRAHLERADGGRLMRFAP